MEFVFKQKNPCVKTTGSLYFVHGVQTLAVHNETFQYNVITNIKIGHAYDTWTFPIAHQQRNSVQLVQNCLFISKTEEVITAVVSISALMGNPP